jgi:WbqC-like protein family
MKVAIHQPNFFPWCGYFNKIKAVEVFIFLDDVQFERGKTYTSRTKIIVNGQEQWLTVPVQNKSGLSLIKDIKVEVPYFWKRKHLKTLQVNYKKALFYEEVFPLIEQIYSINSDYLVDYNTAMLMLISAYLGFKTEFRCASLLSIIDTSGSERIINILKNVSARSYLSGKGEGSRRYINVNEFIANNIFLEWQDYKVIPYKQLNTKDFIPNLSIIDMLLNCGKESAMLL